MQPQWTNSNQLALADLRKEIRDKDVKVGCAAIGCNKPATDVHHMDGEHSNDDPGNLAASCKLCHNDEHGIAAEMSDLKLLTRLFYEAQDQRKAAANRVGAYAALEIDTPYAAKALDDAKEYEKHLAKHVKALLKTDPFYNEWLAHVHHNGSIRYRLCGPIQATSLRTVKPCGARKARRHAGILPLG
jgi:hypothetical protein